MISQYTWPNFRGGSDKEGVRTLMDEKGFSNDVMYGHTKIFIRSPQTLFALEKVNRYIQMIQFNYTCCDIFMYKYFILLIEYAYIIIYSQARSELIPGIVTLLQKQWRGYLCRQKYKKMKAALIVMKHYIKYKQRVYITKLEQTFKPAKEMRDHGKRLPWPPENFAMRHVIPALKNMYARWWAWMVLKVIPREDWPQLRLKVRT